MRAAGSARMFGRSLIPDSNGTRTLAASDIRVTALVIHGTSDPVFHIEHGEAMASAITGATLVRVEGGGHELHKADWPQIIGAIITYTDNL